MTTQTHWMKGTAVLTGLLAVAVGTFLLTSLGGLKLQRVTSAQVSTPEAASGDTADQDQKETA